jgi:hypothetical protein
MIDRRRLLACSGFCVYALLAEARAAVPADSRLAPRRWLLRQDELARGLHAGTVSQLAWHDGVNALAREVDVTELAALIRASETVSAGKPPADDHDPAKRIVRFRSDDGTPAHFAYGTALFAFERDNVITPHAHKHMASAHMVLEGRVRIRTFDRVADEDGALVIRPTLDVVGDPGHAAAMTTAKDNIHWFAPRSTRAMTFDVIVDGLDRGAESYVIQPVDPLGGAARADGTIRAPLLSFAESSRRYTAAM